MAQFLITMLLVALMLWISLKIIDKVRKDNPVDDVKEEIQKKESKEKAEDLAVKSGLTEKKPSKTKTTKKRKDS